MNGSIDTNCQFLRIADLFCEFHYLYLELLQSEEGNFLAFNRCFFVIKVLYRLVYHNPLDTSVYNHLCILWVGENRSV